MTFTAAYRLYGPDVEKIAEALCIAPSDADRLKSWMMDNKPLGRFDKKTVNARARNMAKKHSLREIRRKASA